MTEDDDDKMMMLLINFPLKFNEIKISSEP